jgi:hypothetical protein
MATEPIVSTATEDPFESASNATLAPRSYFGQIDIDAWHCVLIKGRGKVPFDPAQHSRADRRTAITIALLPLPEMKVQFEIKRDLVAESHEWTKFMLPSLKALGLANVRDANGRWAKMQQVGTGRTYRNAKGEEKEATAFKFLALYADEATCRATYAVEAAGHANGNGQAAATATATVADANALNVARPFIAAFARQNQFDIEKTRAACRSQAIITKAIDVDSETFVNIVAEAMAATGGK